MAIVKMKLYINSPGGCVAGTTMIKSNKVIGGRKSAISRKHRTSHQRLGKICFRNFTCILPQANKLYCFT